MSWMHRAINVRQSAGASVAVLSLAVAASCSRTPSARPDTAAAATNAERAKTTDSMVGMDMGSANTSPDSTTADVTLTAAQIRHGGVAWGPVTMGTAAAAVSVPAQLAPNEDRTARLGAPAGGRIVAVRVRPGDRVLAGQLLVSLQSREAAQAQADLAKARAELVARQAEAGYAKSARDRADRLLALKAIPRQDYERTVTDDEHARQGVAQAEAELTRARSAADQLGAGSSASGAIEVRSPLVGVLLERSAVPGTVVDAGAPLVTVTDASSLWVTVNAPESLSGAFRTGTTLRFTVPAYPGETFAAHVDAVGAGLDPATRTLPVRATVDNRTGRLKPEMIATVLADGGPLVPAALVPDSAVQMLKGRPVVFLARPRPDGGARFVRRDVEVGSRSDGRVAITRGLSAGDVIVTRGAFAVKAQAEKGAMPKMEM
jgi:membrane fusion protein, heavy metal efflux system